MVRYFNWDHNSTEANLRTDAPSKNLGFTSPFLNLISFKWLVKEHLKYAKSHDCMSKWAI